MMGAFACACNCEARPQRMAMYFVFSCVNVVIAGDGKVHAQYDNSKSCFSGFLIGFAIVVRLSDVWPIYTVGWQLTCLWRFAFLVLEPMCCCFDSLCVFGLY